MNFASLPSHSHFTDCGSCHSTLSRLIGNLSGFVYRRRHDEHWTMEFLSNRCRDITGYDPHRFIANASIAFGDLIECSDWRRVNERVRLAVLRRQRATVEYRLRTAFGGWARIEDRLIPVVNSAGKVVAIEGIIDYARFSQITTSSSGWTRHGSRSLHPSLSTTEAS